MKKTYFVSLVLGCITFLFSQNTHSYRTADHASAPKNPKFVTVDNLIGEEKYQQAHEEALKLYATAKAGGDSQFITEAIIRIAQLKVGLHKYEEAFEFMRTEKPPTSIKEKVLFHLYYGHVLEAYYHKYQWEIQQREKTEKSKGDIKSWTKKEISDEILRSYSQAMSAEDILSSKAPDYFKYYIYKNTYPAEVRSTLRDLVVYSAVDHLGDSSYWTAKDSNEMYALPIQQMIKGTVPVAMTDFAKHPMLRLASLLISHKNFHNKHGRVGGALEAQYVLFEKAFQHTVEQDQRELLKLLESLQRSSESKKHQWWATGQYIWGKHVVAIHSDEDRYIKAVQIFNDAIKAYPDSYGSQKCAYEKSQIELPNFSLLAMSHDGENKDSVQVNYKNITKLYFHAYAIDLKASMATAPGGEIFSRQSYSDWTTKKWGQPIKKWSQDLPPTKDFTEHKAFVKIPLEKHGGYMIMASTRENFGDEAPSQIEGAPFILTDIVIQRTILNDGKIEVRAINGNTGVPMSGVEISNWTRNESSGWDKPAVKRSTEVTGADGTVRFLPVPKIYEYFQFAQKGDDFAYMGRAWVSDRTQDSYRRILVFTDRSIFRPGQKIYWKVLDVQGNTKTAQFKVSPKERLQVELYDANGKVVASKIVRTNDYGTASGEFIAAKDKVLGSWRIAVRRGADNYAGSTSLRVEEYKRPTFEVKVQDSLQALRLNKKAVVGGEARYYFGQPVASGSIKWTVERTPVWSWWWHGFRSYSAPQTIASGTARIAADGHFKIEFVPKADEREAKDNPGLRYQFTVRADVTDDGGETRNGSKNFQLGFVSLDAQMSIDNEFFNAKKPITIPVTLSDLNGLGKSGSGQWQVVKLVQPDKTLLPADLPLNPEERTHKKHSNIYDNKRPRWSQDYDPMAIIQQWKGGEQSAQGTISHDKQGKGEIRLTAGLEEGAYRLIYKSKDEFGAELKVQKDLLVTGSKNNFQVALLVAQEKSTYEVGETARIFVVSGLKDQILFAEVYSAGIRIKKFEIKNTKMLEVPITEKERGGFSVFVTGVRDYQQFQQWKSVTVPWSNKQLKIETATFRDKIRPGSKETIKLTVKDHSGKRLGANSAELLSFMYDRSLDFFGPHFVDSPLSAYPSRIGTPQVEINLNSVHGTQYVHNLSTAPYPNDPQPDILVFLNSYGIGGPGIRYRGGGEHYEAEMVMADASGAPPAEAESMAAPMAPKAENVAQLKVAKEQNRGAQKASDKNQSSEASPPPLRSDFSETAFWKPHLLVASDGSVSFEYQVPDSLTSWNFWATAITKDVRADVFNKQTQSVKELMVRPYLPRFLRESDEATLKVMINNSGGNSLSGDVELTIEDPETGKSALSDFSLTSKDTKQKFTAPKGGSTTVVFKLIAPKKIKSYAVIVKASSQAISDGEKRLLPVLPGRMHLAQSRFVTLRNSDQKTMEFLDLAKGTDSSLVTDRMVVTVDAQLFYGVLKSLPYLINYPYECAEQTLNRFVSTGIVTEVFKKYPAVQKMAKEFSKRETPLEKFDAPDANQRMALEESPWLQLAEGGSKRDDLEMVKVLDSRAALAERDRALRQLRKMQTTSGGFPWFDGGRPDEYITLYILIGFARANEFNVTVPKDMVVKAWSYLKSWSQSDLKKCMIDKGCHEFVTLLNFTLTSYKDESWTGGVFSAADRKRFLDYSFAAWKQHSPLLKGYLALTLKRMDRIKDAELVWASVMDSAKSTQDLGTYWAPEERSWLWYNDTIETHAFALRVQMELAPTDQKNDGLVQWLFLNKKLNHWKSTKATAESIYSLVHYLEKEKALGVREEITATVGGQDKKFVFDPDKYTGAKNQIVIAGESILPSRDSKITVRKTTPGFAFASSTWHFSTEKVPAAGDGDMFSVSRKYFLREKQGTETVLKPITTGTKIKIGDQIEVQLSLKAKHAAEYVHLRDPRGAGFEPEEQVAGYRYDLGLAYYQEVRDSGGNFFFNRVPVGQYTFKYRIRANMTGTFKVGPATVQSLYAPEFNAYSAGDSLQVAP